MQFSTANTCPGDGIGRRAGFKIRCRKAWRFKSAPGHHPISIFRCPKVLQSLWVGLAYQEIITLIPGIMVLWCVLGNDSAMYISLVNLAIGH